MAFKGLEGFGSGIAKYADLMAQGEKDRVELEDRDARISKEMEQQRLNDSIKIQSAAASSGLFYDQPEKLQQYGGNMVPGYNAAPGSAPVHPYIAHQQREEALKRMSTEAALARANLTAGARNKSQDASSEMANKKLQFDVIGKQLQVLQSETKSPAFYMKSTEERRAVADQIKALVTQMGQLAPSEGAPATKAPSAAPKKFYNAARNQTKLVYPDGREEIVNGKQ